ncbi:hypothetical protein AB0M46_14460 [Dactylosporangium sp. NPDC051485]|uniref:hypothetical protein n=1 Tax=Dactylosporangium sp. NPDC051485 TaxID=3154846 RepID=UPI00342F66C2
MRLTRILVVAVTVAATVAIAPQAALAIPPGTGWSGSWKYTGGTSVQVKLDVPGAKLVANGWDALGTRAFALNITDTVADGKCAYVKWTAAATTEHWACGNGTTEQVTGLPTSTNAITAVLCRDSTAHNNKTNCNVIDVPSSYTDEFIRTEGNGVQWHYYDASEHYDGGEDWGAWITIGDVDFDYFGWDDTPEGQRWIRSFLSVFAPTCASGTLLNATPASSLSYCSQNLIDALPVTHVTGTAWGRGCTWAINSRVPNPPKHCITVRVPEPS